MIAPHMASTHTEYRRDPFDAAAVGESTRPASAKVNA
jgi:hypothetical protein